MSNFLASHGKKVLVTSPRRVAVKAGAQRLSQLHGQKVGEAVGYTIRGSKRVSPNTAVEFLTPGILLRRLLTNPGLDDIGAVIIDEVHERGLETDMVLAALIDLRQIRPDLRLITMSATAQVQQLHHVLGEAAVLHSRGMAYPVSITHKPPMENRVDDRGVSRAFLDHVVSVSYNATRDHSGSDILIFLPGRREITYVVDRLHEQVPERDVIPLYSGIDDRSYNKIFLPNSQTAGSRIIVATDVAETSVTVEGVDVVIDSCLSRQPKVDNTRGMSGLVTTAASKAACDQRAGRAGRTGPGFAYRLVDQAVYAAAPSHSEPEILVADLTWAALFLSCWGTPYGRGLQFVDPFPSDALDTAYGRLKKIGAVDDRARPTAIGREIARMPLHPVYATAALKAAPVIGARRAASIIALLTLSLHGDGADLVLAYQNLRRGDHPLSQEWQKETQRIRSYIPDHADSRWEITRAIGYVCALAGGTLAHCTQGNYLLSSGTRAALPPNSTLRGQEWLVVMEATLTRNQVISAGTGALIGQAAPLTIGQVKELFPFNTIRSTWVEEYSVTASESLKSGAITLSKTRKSPSLDEIVKTVLNEIQQRGLRGFTMDTTEPSVAGTFSVTPY